ncbi:hypothetical protein IEO21_04745 [Rhodonia placenta]|uniref:Uncharacterized protein n=1 Tax=Rhodonia placenta TaxID=104341 RepID=A0A8H7P373_9APHY|nr:hypothetical protein IEO21_04745 [Postia placenta]
MAEYSKRERFCRVDHQGGTYPAVNKTVLAKGAERYMDGPSYSCAYRVARLTVRFDGGSWTEGNESVANALSAAGTHGKVKKNVDSTTWFLPGDLWHFHLAPERILSQIHQCGTIDGLDRHSGGFRPMCNI